MNKIIVITAPSGSGKTTLVKKLLERYSELEFSISACTRNPRKNEVHGRDYYFHKEDHFKEMISCDHFLEWEMVYTGHYYGTLNSELDRIWNNEKCPLIDIDVNGALSIKDKFPEKTLSIFIKAPTIEHIKERLIARGTESEETLKTRIEKAEHELKFADKFDSVIVNDTLDQAVDNIIQTVSKFIG